MSEFKIWSCQSNLGTSSLWQVIPGDLCVPELASSPEQVSKSFQKALFPLVLKHSYPIKFPLGLSRSNSQRKRTFAVITLPRLPFKQVLWFVNSALEIVWGVMTLYCLAWFALSNPVRHPTDWASTLDAALLVSASLSTNSAQSKIVFHSSWLSAFKIYSHKNFTNSLFI